MTKPDPKDALPKSQADKTRDEVLRRMLKTPPKPHAHGKTTKKPR